MFLHQKLRLTLYVLLALLDIPQMAFSQDDCEVCKAVLIPSITSQSSNKREQLSFLRILNQQSYEQIQRDRGIDFSIPIEGVPIKFDANYANFDIRRNQLFEQSSFNSSVDEATTFLSSALSAESIAAWRECINACMNKTGIKAKISYESPSSVAVTYLWFPPNGAFTTGNVTSSTVVGGSNLTFPATPPGQALPIGYQFSNNSQVTVLYNRTPGQAFLINLNVNGVSTPVLSLPAVSPPKTINQARIDLEHINISNDQGFHETISPGSPAQFRLFATAEAVTATNTVARPIQGIVSVNDGSSRLTPSINGAVTAYPVNKSAFISILPGDQRIRVTCFVALEVALPGGVGGLYMTDAPQFTITLDRNADSWIATPGSTSPTLQGFWNGMQKFQGTLQYQVKFSSVQ